MSSILRVAGRCPGCGSSTLYLDIESGDRVLCHRSACADPGAADRVLADGEVAHIVEFAAERFQVQHPLVERGESLFNCGLHQRLSALSGPPVPLGRYRVSVDLATDELVYHRVTS